MTRLNKREKLEVSFNCIKEDIATILKRFNATDKSLFYSEAAINTLTGIRSTLFFMYGENNELYILADNAIKQVISRND